MCFLESLLFLSISVRRISAYGGRRKRRGGGIRVSFLCHALCLQDLSTFFWGSFYPGESLSRRIIVELNWRLQILITDWPTPKIPTGSWEDIKAFLIFVFMAYATVWRILMSFCEPLSFIHWLLKESRSTAIPWSTRCHRRYLTTSYDRVYLGKSQMKAECIIDIKF